MTNTSPIGFPEAARHLGVPVRLLRQAIRAGRILAPPHAAATATLSPEWLASAQAAVKASPRTLARTGHQKVPPFARYEGTSAWRKYRNRVREFNSFNAALNAAETSPRA
jgi:hypothetical protein